MKRKEKKIVKDGKVVGWSSRPSIWSKYWHRLKMKLKKNHDRFCRCYWCLKKQFSTNIPCPKCGRMLRSFGWHINRGFNDHESGFGLKCKCGYSKQNAS